MSNFSFLSPEFSFLFECGKDVEKQVILDPRAACFRARYGLERAVLWLYENDRSLRTPYDTKLDTLLNSSSFKTLVPQMTFNKMMAIKKMGNQAVHSRKTVTENDSLATCKELFHVFYWIARTYTRQGDPRGFQVIFKADKLPRPVDREKLKQAMSSMEDIKAREEKIRSELKERENALAQREKLMTTQARSIEEREAQLDEDTAKVRRELAKVKEQNEAVPDEHDYSEDDTRKFIIDLLLREAGWQQGKDWTEEVEVKGMPNEQGVGFVDYVLWGDDGLPLAVVEAKRTNKDAQVGQQQAKLYADCLENMKGRRPLIFYTNGYETWLWDDTDYPPRVVQGFYSKAEIQVLMQRRSIKKSLLKAKHDDSIAGRPYQARAIRSIGEHFESNHRKALLTMATGTGKTRTSIALVKLLMDCNWAKRVLFLADRVALVNQAVNAFKSHFPDASPVNLVKEKNNQGRVDACTYPTMMGLIEKLENGRRRYGVGYYDIIVIDEAHRSVYQKYGAIFGYFDALLVGLTATPREEVHHDTYHLFGLETGVPTDAYGLDEAVKDEFLVPPRSMSIPIRYPREGIVYDDLSPDEKEHWESLAWDEEEGTPDGVSSSAVNKWVFNEDTVDKVLMHLMENGQKVDGGDKLGKTIIFAKNQKHAEYIEQRFNHHYPLLAGHFARIITHNTPYAQSVIDDFSETGKNLQIAISVDMLDTGIDVPEVVNLVFFKVVRSKTKFLQMIGRGTRLCPDLFGPGQNKESFTIFDFCGNLEFFKENPEGIEGGHSEPLQTRLFKQRLELLEVVSELPKELSEGSPPEYGTGSEVLTVADVLRETKDLLHREVTAMNCDNFIIRPKRQFVETYQNRQSWDRLNRDRFLELYTHVSGLPNELEPETMEAKLFDFTCLKLQLALLKGDERFSQLSQQVINLASNLEEKEAIPMVKQQMVLIQRVQSEEFWKEVTLTELENVRRKLRDLIQFVDKRKREPVYTLLQDEMGEGEEVVLDNFEAGINMAQYRKKVEQYIRSHEDHITIHKLKHNLPLTPKDLEELDDFLFKTGEAQSLEQFEEVFGRQESLPLFIRSLVGLDRNAAKQAFGNFLSSQQYTTAQMRFVEMIIDHLTKRGIMDPGLLYEQPFTGVHYEGLDGVFPGAKADEIINILEMVNQNAVG